jgi:hypothetical protein
MCCPAGQRITLGVALVLVAMRFASQKQILRGIGKKDVRVVVHVGETLGIGECLV